ncbi:hypothetical protein HYDPIDRAFT_119988 [Hydnomerulius pinastri MD-312]|uniref:Uncharacterized protein n=1 Tax=Hydnomerulius pinastri MD-312 TaxID=994086 RepID=A0A0C9W727_9AGAM|nr:hypothetical protein HYDPIDRAFT_119988 [Hydnomerulius pinastri MD-312]
MSDRTSSPDTQHVFTQSVFTVFKSTHASSYATMGMIHITPFRPPWTFPSSP